MLKTIGQIHVSARVRPAFAAVLAGTTLFVAAIACGSFLYFEAVRALKDEVRGNLVRAAKAAATAVDADAHAKWQSRSEESSDEYRQAINALRRIQRSDPSIAFVYTCVLVDGRVYFVLDPTEDGDADGDGIPDKSHIMDPYPEASDVLIEALKTGRPIAEEEPQADRWGTFISGYAPLRNSRGEVVGIVGVDLAAEDYVAKLASVKNSAMAATWIAFAVSFVIAILVFFITRAAARAEAATERSMGILSTQKTVLEMVAANAPLDAVLHSICRMAEDQVSDSKWMIVVFGAGVPGIYTGKLDADGEEGLYALSEFNKTRTGIEPGFETAYYEVRSRTDRAMATVCVCYRRRGVLISQVNELGQAISQLAAIAIERRLIDQELADAHDKALEAARTKATFLATMSHEIRTPMNAVLGMTDLLLASGLKKNQRTFAETIRDSAQTLLALINDILAFSKLESGSDVKEEVEFDLRELCETVCSLLAPTAHAKGLELVCSLPPVIPHRFRSDSHKIKQVLINLIGNAVKFTEAGTVALTVTLPMERASGSLVRISVKDTGIGIPQDRIGAIFETFVQGDASTTRKYGGTGLGLAICKQIVALLGGRISATSEVGAGSEFIVELDLDHGSETGEALLAESEVRGTVLVVDDNEASRHAVCNVVKGLGFEAVGADTAEEASALLSQARLQPYFALVVEQHLVNRIAKRAIQDATANGTRIVMMQPLVSAAKSRRQTQRVQCVNKPVRRKEFIEALVGRTCQVGNGEGGVLPIRGLHVLVADDNPTNRRVAMYLLKRLGHTADFAENGKQALEMISGSSYDGVLMDIEMPEMDGLEAIERIRQLEGAERTVPIIALTAHAIESEVAKKAIEVGATGVLGKPVTLDRLAEALEAWGGRSRTIRAA